METTLSPVWISSVEHLDEFNNITRPRWKFLLRLKKLPKGFPQIQTSFGTFPTVFFSHGTLSLFPRVLEYRCDFHPVIKNGRFRNLLNDLKFEVEYTSITISHFTNGNPLLNAFNLTWIRLEFDFDDAPYDLLLSVGGENLTKAKAAVQNKNLFDIIERKGAKVQ